MKSDIKPGTMNPQCRYCLSSDAKPARSQGWVHFSSETAVLLTADDSTLTSGSLQAVVVPRRHSRWLHELSRSEAADLGLIGRMVARVIHGMGADPVEGQFGQSTNGHLLLEFPIPMMPGLNGEQLTIRIEKDLFTLSL